MSLRLGWLIRPDITPNSLAAAPLDTFLTRVDIHRDASTHMQSQQTDTLVNVRVQLHQRWCSQHVRVHTHVQTPPQVSLSLKTPLLHRRLLFLLSLKHAKR